MKTLKKMIRNNKGATAIEYGLLAALISVAAIGAVKGVGTKVKDTFTTASTAMNNGTAVP